MFGMHFTREEAAKYVGRHVVCTAKFACGDLWRVSGMLLEDSVFKLQIERGEVIEAVSKFEFEENFYPPELKPVGDVVRFPGG